jgi:hypothetical protein
LDRLHRRGDRAGPAGPGGQPPAEIDLS